MTRRVVAREDFCSGVMSCNYYQRHDNIWKLHLADGRMYQDTNLDKSDAFIEEQLKNGQLIELLENEIVTY